jgi:hypothetical protein
VLLLIIAIGIAVHSIVVFYKVKNEKCDKEYTDIEWSLVTSFSILCTATAVLFLYPILKGNKKPHTATMSPNSGGYVPMTNTGQAQSTNV